MRVALAAFLFFSAHAFACINSYEEDLTIMMDRGDPEEITATVKRLETENAKQPTTPTRNDLGVAYILSGQYDSAVRTLESLEKDDPGQSRTASNLGTALELSGRNEEALRWIKEGIVRDPQDHEGTEWLHVKILEAKVALGKDANWLKSHTVLGVSFGSAVRPEAPTALPSDQSGPRSWEETEKAMHYQLGERLKFVKAPDPIVASLFRSRADIAYLRQSAAAPDYYLAAELFGDPGKDLLKQRAEQFRADAAGKGSQPAASDGEAEAGPVSYGTIAAALLVLVVGSVLYVVYKRPGRSPGAQ